jgi:flagellin-like hook-associated protein FlgL
VASGSIIEGLLAQMRDAAASAADPSVNGDARAALNAGFQSGLSQIQAAVAAAGVDGVNLIDGGASSGQAPAGLAAFDLTPSGSLIGLPAGASLSDPAAAASLAAQLNKALGSVGQAVSALGDQADDLQSGFVSAMQSGSSSFDPALDADGARLAALQIQQQLSGGGGSIGNQAPAAILALFR